MQLDLPSPLAVALHDAGAANLVLSWLKHYDGELKASVAGPAALLWSRAFPAIPPQPLTNSFEGASALLTGTGWASDFEHEARKLARHIGIRNIAVLDHWVNYRDRFVRDGEHVLPDELWVADQDALQIARGNFPGIPLRQLPNLYLDELVQAVLAHKPDAPRREPKKILYLLEPIRQRWGNDEGPGELQALDFFLKHLSAIGSGTDVEICLRPHPSDPPDKYEVWRQQFHDFNLRIDSAEALSKQIAWADWVVGCETFALVIALAAKRIVMSTLPPWAPTCRLPQRDLLHLRDWVRTSV